VMLHPIMAAVRNHHERWDGSGYPDKMKDAEIPLAARIVAIADAYDAMIHDRPYKRAISHAEAIEELRRHSGTQFDPELVELFCDLYSSHAPEPDVTILALNAGPTAHELILPDPGASRGRRRRRTDIKVAGGRDADATDEDDEAASTSVTESATETHTMAAEGSIGLLPEPSPGTTVVMPRRSQADTDPNDFPPTLTPSRVGRGASAAG
jgi:HD domain